MYWSLKETCEQIKYLGANIASISLTWFCYVTASRLTIFSLLPNYFFSLPVSGRTLLAVLRSFYLEKFVQSWHVDLGSGVCLVHFNLHYSVFFLEENYSVSLNVQRQNFTWKVKQRSVCSLLSVVPDSPNYMRKFVFTGLNTWILDLMVAFYVFFFSWASVLYLMAKFLYFFKK